MSSSLVFCGECMKGKVDKLVGNAKRVRWINLCVSPAPVRATWEE